jgi:pSer/pThr/pTyr-binding forkhead associated (FHA) protein
MGTKPPTKPGGPGAGYDWDDDWPTDVKDLLRKQREQGGADVSVPKAAPVPQGDTKRYPSAAKRLQAEGAALPSFLIAYVDVIGGPDAGTTHPITMVHTLIGRGPEADIRVRDESASRRHASILYAEGEFRVRDEQSSNGTFLNGSKVVEYAIRDRDKLLVGDSLLQFHLGKKL